MGVCHAAKPLWCLCEQACTQMCAWSHTHLCMPAKELRLSGCSSASTAAMHAAHCRAWAVCHKRCRQALGGTGQLGWTLHRGPSFQPGARGGHGQQCPDMQRYAQELTTAMAGDPSPDAAWPLVSHDHRPANLRVRRERCWSQLAIGLQPTARMCTIQPMAGSLSRTSPPLGSASRWGARTGWLQGQSSCTG